jgi:hypothetical protein
VKNERTNQRKQNENLDLPDGNDGPLRSRYDAMIESRYDAMIEKGHWARGLAGRTVPQNS